MDTEPVSYEEFAQCLRHLELINHCTLAYRPTLQWVKQLPREKALTIFDIGSGGGDMMRKIWRLRPGYRMTGIDMNPYSKEYAETHAPPKSSFSYITKNLFELDLSNKPDLIISALFTHHLTDEQLVSFILWMHKNAARGWFINDLHRHRIAYYGIKAITAFLPFNRFVKHDAAVSVARSFTRSDWLKLLDKAGIEKNSYKIRWHFPFRYCVECTVNE